MFVDQAKIYIKAGDGGNGCHSIYHDRYMRYGRPDGGEAAMAPLWYSQPMITYRPSWIFNIANISKPNPALTEVPIIKKADTAKTLR